MKTTSELAFEKFLSDNGLSFQRVQEQDEPRPDYIVQFGDLRMFFEVKELAKDENFKTGPLQVSRRTIGDHIRSKINEARKQVQFGAQRGSPSVLLIYNNLDSMHLFGTEDMDFISAMYGERTLLLDRNTLKVVDSFQGRNKSLDEEKNTSFSAVGRLYPLHGDLKVTLFENAFAKVKIPFNILPPSFEVRRVDIATAKVSSVQS